MEPTKQGVPGDPSSSQQQPQPQQYPPQSTLPPHRRAVQRPLPQQQNPPLFALPPPQHAVQSSQPQQQYPASFALPPRQHVVQCLQPQQQYPASFALPPQQHAVQHPQLPSLQRPLVPYLSMPQAHRWGYTPHVGAAIPGGINASHYGAGTPHFNGSIFLANHGQTSARGPQAGATDPFSARNDDASLDPYIFALLSADQVAVACTRGVVSLLDVANGVTSLQNLLESVKYPQLRWQLIHRLLYEGLFRHRRGPDLLRRIFTTATFRYQDSSIVIRHALDNFLGVFSSKFGSNSMVECFKAARNLGLQAELQVLQQIISSNIVQIAEGEFSNFFLQEVLEDGWEQLRVKITDLVVEHVVRLSLDRHGSYVVQACFPGVAARGLPWQVQQRIPLALEKCQHLPDDLLGQLVENNSASYALCSLLVSGKNGSPEQTEVLAWRIKELPVARLDGEHPVVTRVMKVVWMVLPRRARTWHVWVGRS